MKKSKHDLFIDELQKLASKINGETTEELSDDESIVRAIEQTFDELFGQFPIKKTNDEMKNSTTATKKASKNE